MKYEKGDEKMKLGYFTTHFPYSRNYSEYTCGGAELVAHNLTVSIAQKGHEIVVFTTSISSKDTIERHNNVELYRYSKNFSIGAANISPKLLYKPLGHEVDIVHAHAGNPPAPIAAYWYAKKKHKPFVVSCHGDVQWNWGGFVRRTSVCLYGKYILDKILSYADVVISASEYYINNSKFLWKYRDKIVVIPYGINLADFDIQYLKDECRAKLGLPSDDRIVLFLGGFAPHKGPDVLLKAMPKIVNEAPDAKLVFVGNGRMRAELEGLSKKLDVEEHIKFAGFVDNISKALYYKSSDVFVLPSFSECSPLVNLEAMACGIPIVASNIGGVPDSVSDGENGLLVPPGDPEALADAIIYLLENEDVGKRMGKNGRTKVEYYSWEKVAEETEKVYLSLGADGR